MKFIIGIDNGGSESRTCINGHKDIIKVSSDYVVIRPEKFMNKDIEDKSNLVKIVTCKDSRAEGVIIGAGVGVKQFNHEQVRYSQSKRKCRGLDYTRITLFNIVKALEEVKALPLNGGVVDVTLVLTVPIQEYYDTTFDIKQHFVDTLEGEHTLDLPLTEEVPFKINVKKVYVAAEGIVIIDNLPELMYPEGTVNLFGDIGENTFDNALLNGRRVYDAHTPSFNTAGRTFNSVFIDVLDDANISITEKQVPHILEKRSRFEGDTVDFNEYVKEACNQFVDQYLAANLLKFMNRVSVTADSVNTYTIVGALAIEEMGQAIIEKTGMVNASLITVEGDPRYLTIATVQTLVNNLATVHIGEKEAPKAKVVEEAPIKAELSK